MSAGLTRHMIAARLDSGRWQRPYPGVYATFSGQLPRPAELWAAILRVGHEAVLSHQTAAEAWRLIDQPTPAVHVTVNRQAGTLVVAGIVLHYSARLPASRHPARLPPVTLLEETVLDLAERSASAEDAVAWAIKACQRRMTIPSRITSAMTERQRMRYRSDVRDALADVQSGVHSPLELRYLRNVERKHGLPHGDRQFAFMRGGRKQYLDVAYPDYGVIVELDGVMAHPQAAKRHDARRDNASTLQGKLTLRYDWIAVAYHPCATALEVGTLLAARGWRGRARPCGPACQLSQSPRST